MSDQILKFHRVPLLDDQGASTIKLLNNFSFSFIYFIKESIFILIYKKTIKLSVVFTEETHSYQLQTKFHPALFSQLYFQIYTKLFEIINIETDITDRLLI
jgi:hypothetical protein